MYSKPISTSQTSIHKDLETIVRKHDGTVFARPIADHTRKAFDDVARVVMSSEYVGKSVILDSCCGTGESTLHWARQFPDALVIGIDKSANRLERFLPYQLHQTGTPSETSCINAVRIRADVIDFWRLVMEAGWKIERHYLLYPNPYPKPHHIKNRWHGHPVLPVLMSLSDVTELRTNWRIYAEEMMFAYTLRGGQSEIEEFEAMPAITAFERKYAQSGHRLYRVLLYSNSHNS